MTLQEYGVQLDKLEGTIEAFSERVARIEGSLFHLSPAATSSIPPPVPPRGNSFPQRPLPPQVETNATSPYASFINKQSSSRVLPSSVINKDDLTPASLVIKQYEGLAGKEAKMSTLTQLLAKESFFGEQVMVKCTTFGCEEKPGLPRNGVG